MSFRLLVRMAQFKFEQKVPVHQPENSVAFQSHFDEKFSDQTKCMATIHWTVDPSLGFPAAPYLVQMAATPIHVKQYGHYYENGFILKARNGYFAPVISLSKRVGPDGLLCLTARMCATQGIEIFATDAVGYEIPETRQSAVAPDGAAFLGPGIHGLRATGDVKLTKVTAVALPHLDLNALDLVVNDLAHVAPPFEVEFYNPQRYLGKQYSPTEAMQIRLFADALARNSTPAPPSSRLELEIHRRNPLCYAEIVRNQEFFKQSKENIGKLVNNGNWSFSMDDEDTSMTLYPSRLWQYLSLMGPIEATTLGQAVSVPLPQNLNIWKRGNTYSRKLLRKTRK